jgi:hypothetical protein
MEISSRFWMTDHQWADPEYLNYRNNAGYYHPIKNLDCKIGRFHWSDLKEIKNPNAQIPDFLNIQDLFFEGR